MHKKQVGDAVVLNGRTMRVERIGWRALAAHFQAVQDDLPWAAMLSQYEVWGLGTRCHEE